MYFTYLAKFIGRKLIILPVSGAAIISASVWWNCSAVSHYSLKKMLVKVRIARNDIYFTEATHLHPLAIACGVSGAIISIVVRDRILKGHFTSIQNVRSEFKVHAFCFSEKFFNFVLHAPCRYHLRKHFY
jgi:hypothetical protein